MKGEPALPAELSTADPPWLLPPRSAYIHVPFCRHRCGYCDFALVARRDDLVPAYLDALEAELRSLGEPVEVSTLFFGGGTPTHLEPVALRRLLELVTRWCAPAGDCEFSVEANPLDLTEERLDLLRDVGVNRLSLGVQSFFAETLQFLERDHQPRDLEHILQRVRRRFENFSLDLIFGVPGQSLDEWDKTLSAAIAAGPTHLSTYGLTIEKGTAFWTRREKGLLAPLCEETERKMYALAMSRLSEAGFAQYEISSFARPGYRCRHNQVYWSGGTYYGFGPGAASQRDGSRRLNHRSVSGWLKRVQSGVSAVAETETLSHREKSCEYFALALRTNDGVCRETFRHATGFRVEELLGTALEANIRRRLLSDNGERISLTIEGRFVADAVVGDFLAAD